MSYTLIEAVNHVLIKGNETPITSLTNDSSSASTIARDFLEKERRFVLSEGLRFNTRTRTFSPDINSHITFGSNVIAIDGHGVNKSNKYTLVNGRVFDIEDQTDEFTSSIELKVLYDYDFDQMPVWVQWRIMTEAAYKFLVQFAPDSNQINEAMNTKRQALNRCNEKELQTLDIDIRRKSAMGAAIYRAPFLRWS